MLPFPRAHPAALSVLSLCVEILGDGAELPDARRPPWPPFVLVAAFRIPAGSASSASPFRRRPAVPRRRLLCIEREDEAQCLLCARVSPDLRPSSSTAPSPFSRRPSPNPAPLSSSRTAPSAVELCFPCASSLLFVQIEQQQVDARVDCASPASDRQVGSKARLRPPAGLPCQIAWPSAPPRLASLLHQRAEAHG